jgi:NADH-quinone oxidoreductase subunit L
MTPPGFFLAYLWLIPLFPLLAAALMFLLGRLLPKSAVSFFCVGSAALSFIFSAGAVFQLLTAPPAQRSFQQILFDWITPAVMPVSGGLVVFVADWGYLLDPLSCVMLLIATGVSFLVHLYSIGSMRRDPGYYRYFGVLNLCLFSMITLVLANNLLLLFAGWEGIALCSYLMVGFFFPRKSASDAANKAFLFNLIGDTGFLLGIFLVAATFGTVRFTSQGLSGPSAFQGIGQVLAILLDEHALAFGAPILTAIALLLFAGAIGKAAQLPLHLWLPDATEAPIPASALIQSATMVAAGVYIVVRMNAVYQLAPIAMGVIAAVGTITAVYAAWLAMVQTDIKKVLAYSTISQLGYIFLALGVGAFSAGIFHLMTHAFFKSLLILGAGSLIYALSGEQDIRKMGGMANAIPGASRPFLIATLAIAGLPPFAGFFSQHEILAHTIGRSQIMDGYLLLWVVGVITAGLTAFYSFRLLFLAFYGRSRVSPELEVRIQQPPPSMVAAMMILAFLCIIGGWFALPLLWGERNTFALFLAPVLGGVELEPSVIQLSAPALFKEYLLMLAPLVAAAIGIWLAYRIYLKRPKLREKIAADWPRLYRLLVHNFYMEEFCEALFVNRLKDLSIALGFVDDQLIDGIAINGSARLARFFSRVSIWFDKWIVDGGVRTAASLAQRLSHPVRLFQSGVFSTYVMWMLLGLVLLLGYYGHHMQVWVRTLR